MCLYVFMCIHVCMYVCVCTHVQRLEINQVSFSVSAESSHDSHSHSLSTQEVEFGGSDVRHHLQYGIPETQNNPALPR